jgi:hypothetical protein
MSGQDVNRRTMIRWKCTGKYNEIQRHKPEIFGRLCQSYDINQSVCLIPFLNSDKTLIPRDWCTRKGS